MKTEENEQQLVAGSAPNIPDDWYFLLLENQTSCRCLIRPARRSACLSLGSFLEKGPQGRRELPGYSPEAEAELGRIVADLLSEGVSGSVPLFLYWVSLAEAVEDARLRTIFRCSGCSSLGEFLDRGQAWRLELPGYGQRSEQLLAEAVERLVRRMGAEQRRRIGELVCQLRSDPIALCRRLKAEQFDFPLRLLKIRLLEEVDLPVFLREIPIDLGQVADGLCCIATKRDLLEQLALPDATGLEVALFAQAESLLEASHWTPEICDRFVPTWVLDRLVVSSTSSRLLVRRAERYGWRCYRDILHASGRCGLYAFGPELEELLWEEVRRLTGMGPVWDRSTDVNAEPLTLLASLQASIERLSPRESQLLSRRLGLEASGPSTLQQLGCELGVTRERARQIEEGAWKQIKRREPWTEVFDSKLERLLEQYCGVVALSKLAEDPWMSDAAVEEPALAALLKHLPSRPAYIYPTRDRQYIVELRRTQFDRLRNLLYKRIAQQHFPLPLEEFLQRLTSAIPQKNVRQGFARRFVEVFGPLMDQSAEGQVFGYVGSPAGMAKAILADSPTPLHFHEIHSRMEIRCREEGLAGVPTLNQVRHILVSHPKILLFEPGSYGLEQHFPDIEHYEGLCLPVALDLLENSPKPRSASQLHRQLIGQLDLPAWFTHYHLSILLRRCPQAEYHGRLVFSFGSFAQSRKVAT